MRRPTLALALSLLVVARLAADGAPAAERTLELLSFAAAGYAALAFAAGDPPRRPWALRTAAIGLVLLAHLIDPLQAAGGPRIAHGILIVANVLGAAAMLRFLALVRASGLAAPISGAARLILGALATGAIAALAICVSAVVGDPPTTDAALLRALTLVVSAGADLIVFVVAARLVQAVLPMRDGAAAQPYLLLAIDGLFFLIIDVVHATGVGAGSGVLAVATAIGGAAGVVAALAQAQIVRRPGGREPPASRTIAA